MLSCMRAFASSHIGRRRLQRKDYLTSVTKVHQCPQEHLRVIKLRIAKILHAVSLDRDNGVDEP